MIHDVRVLLFFFQVGISSKRINGFVSSSFIRPPITIDIEFCIPIHLKEIIINTKVESIQSIGFRLFLSPGSEEFTQIASYFTNKERLIRLKNPAYRSNSQFPSTNAYKIPSHVTLLDQFMSHKKCLGIGTVRQLRLQVLKTDASGSGPGCIPLGGIVVVGHPSQLASSDEKWQKVLSCYHNYRASTDAQTFPWVKPVLVLAESSAIEPTCHTQEKEDGKSGE